MEIGAGRFITLGENPVRALSRPENIDILAAVEVRRIDLHGYSIGRAIRQNFEEFLFGIMRTPDGTCLDAHLLLDRNAQFDSTSKEIVPRGIDPIVGIASDQDGSQAGLHDFGREPDSLYYRGRLSGEQF